MPLRCPECKSKRVTKNGHTRHGKQNHECQKCDKQFSENPENKRITASEKEQIKKLLLERISLRGICRVVGVSLQWLLCFMSSIYKELPDDLNVKIKVSCINFMIINNSSNIFLHKYSEFCRNSCYENERHF